MIRLIGLMATMVALAGSAQQNPVCRGENAGGKNDAGQRVPHLLLRPGVAESVGVTPATLKTIREGLAELGREQAAASEALRTQTRAHSELAAKVLTEPKADTAALARQIEEIGQLRTTLALVNLRKLVLLRDNLTAEQLESLNRRAREQEKKGGGLGRGEGAGGRRQEQQRQKRGGKKAAEAEPREAPAVNPGEL